MRAIERMLEVDPTTLLLYTLMMITLFVGPFVFWYLFARLVSFLKKG
jgi:hypothetical protein